MQSKSAISTRHIGDIFESRKTDNLRERLIKIFDNALLDVHSNLSGSFGRFQRKELANANAVKDKQQIIDVMMKTTSRRED